MEKFAYLSSLPFEKYDEETGLVRGVEAFKAGTWRGKTYTIEHLKQMAENFHKLKEEGLLEPPMKVDHSESARDLVGWITNLYVEGDSLMADVHFTEQEAIEKVKRGTWKKVSSEIYTNYREESNGKDYGMVFRALSIVSIPHLKNIKGIVLNAEEEDGMTLEDIKKLLDEKFAGIEQGKQDFSELTENIMEKFKAFYEGEVQKYKEEAEKAKEDAKKMAEAVKASQIEKEVRAYAEAGKVVPAQEETLKKLLATFSEEQAELFKKFMEDHEAVDVGKQHSNFDEDKSIDDMTPEELAKKYLY